jgi:glycosyltransferase involved in cell wall biosynthesis
MAHADRESIIVLIPVFNDWESLLKLVALLDNQFVAHAQNAMIQVVAIDDGSVERPPEDWTTLQLSAIARIDLLEMRYNLGHQRALAVGLSYIEANLPCTAVVIMDADGEDNPRDVPVLLQHLRNSSSPVVVFAERLKRSEGLLFRVCYHSYRLTHYLLTGVPVRVGNFSVIPSTLLSRLVGTADLWNHFAASVLHSRLPVLRIPTSRGTRLAGQSRMNMVSLFIHGFSAISVFSDRVVARMLLIWISLALFIAVTGTAVLAIRFATDWAIPGWAMSMMGMIFVMLFQIATFLVVFTFVVLGARNRATFLPMRDYPYFVMKFYTVWSPKHFRQDAS